MKKLIFLFTMSVVLTLNSVSQNPLWSLPGGIYNFNNPGITLLPTGDYTGDPAQFAHNAMHDAQGNLLFFVMDGRYCSVV
jgi:hypothetical protein